MDSAQSEGSFVPSETDTRTDYFYVFVVHEVSTRILRLRGEAVHSFLRPLVHEEPFNVIFGRRPSENRLISTLNSAIRSEIIHDFASKRPDPLQAEASSLEASWCLGARPAKNTRVIIRAPGHPSICICPSIAMEI